MGSHENEQMARDTIENEILKIIAAANPKHSIEYEIQVASGSFPIDGYTSVYQAVQNVVVKLVPMYSNAESSVLINSHYDSVPSSNGAGDAIIMISVMLETLRVLSQSNLVFRNSFIFLFNGAEENGLQGAHGFISQHKWASQVKALINLDSAGSGGKERLFQHNSKWLLNLYIKHAPHPLTIVTAQEMFDANLIPSDTDFRIFRDFGNVSGNFTTILYFFYNI